MIMIKEINNENFIDLRNQKLSNLTNSKNEVNAYMTYMNNYTKSLSMMEKIMKKAITDLKKRIEND